MSGSVGYSSITTSSSMSRKSVSSGDGLRVRIWITKDSLCRRIDARDSVFSIEVVRKFGKWCRHHSIVAQT
ncbi:hypothetical protein TNCV_4147601 [Trichonephila clavipes]|nr:hypothetical protein TNCV_4147601 [Trichonephila clavipes]